MTPGLTPEEIAIITEILRAFPAVESAVLFGSRAMGNHKPGSDVDLVLKGDLDLDELTKIAYRLNEESPLPYFFDCVAYGSITSERLLEHIREFGIKIY